MRTRRASRGGQRGTTMVELMFTLAMFGLLLGVVVRFVFNGRASMTRAENASELLSRATLISANLRGGLQTTNTLLCNYAANTPDFSGLRGIVKASALAGNAPDPVTFSTEPTVMEVGKPDLTGPSGISSSSWGDEIMYIATLNPVTFTVVYGVTGTTTPGESVSVNRVQLVYVYLSRDPASRIPVANMGAGGLRLTEWRSQPMVSYEDLNAFSDNPPYYRLTSSCAKLMTMGYSTAFDISHANDTTTSFYRISATAALKLSPTAAPTTIAQSSWAYVDDYSYQENYKVQAGKDFGRISRQGSSGRSSGPSTYVMAFNTLTTSAAHPDVAVNGLMAPGAGITGLQVPAYAQTDLGGSAFGFPGGFEITVVGKPHARIFFARTVLMAVSGAYPKYGTKVYPAIERHTSLAIDNDY